MPQALGVAANPWAQRRRRAAELIERWPFAAEPLAFYVKLLEVQELVWTQGRSDLLKPSDVITYGREQTLPRVIDLTVASGPAKLALSVVERFYEVDFDKVASDWLEGAALEPVDRFLVRAAIGPVLEAIGAACGSLCAGPRDERHCPNCGGSPQLSYFAASAESLVTAQRYLECERCATSWAYPRMTCASCGETKPSLLPIFCEQGTTYAEVAGHVIRQHGPAANEGAQEQASRDAPRFPHIRIDGCDTCSHYLLNIDLERDPHAVPVVDEIAALPLDLYAKERRMVKIASNLMGF